MSKRMQHFSPREAYAEYIRGGVLVDVRDHEEIATKSLGIKQLIKVPLNELGERLAEIPSNRTVMLVSRVGNKGQEAAKFLLQNGYANVVLVDGGLTAWEKEGLPVNYSA